MNDWLGVVEITVAILAQDIEELQKENSELEEENQRLKKELKDISDYDYYKEVNERDESYKD